MPVSSMPILWLDKFVDSDSIQLPQGQEAIRGCSTSYDSQLQSPIPQASPEVRGDKREINKEANDTQISSRSTRQLTIEDIICNMMSGVPRNVMTKKLKTSKSRRHKPESALFARSKTRQFQYPQLQLNTQDDTGRATVVVLPSVERQKRSFLQAKYVCRLHRTRSKAKSQADRLPSSEKVRQVIEQTNDNRLTDCKRTGANAHRVSGDASQQQNLTPIIQRSKTQLSYTTSHLRAKHREQTAIQRPQTSPFPSTQDAVSLTVLRPSSGYCHCRSQTSSGVSIQSRSSGSATPRQSLFHKTTYPTPETEIEITATKISRMKRPQLKQTHNS